MIRPENFDFEKLVRIEKENVLQTYARTPLEFTHGEGVYLFNSAGEKFLDMSSGIAVNALGHAHPKLVKTIADNASSLLHISNLFYHRQPILLAQKLVEHSFSDKVFLCNSGTEANEAALKFARKYARHKSHTEKTGVVAFHGGFHGRTFGALAATSKPAYREPFAPLMPGVVFADFNKTEGLEQLINSHTCAVIVEPIQGEGGVHVASAEFLTMLRSHCNKNDALLIFDEVQCGMGRTGKLWAHEAENIYPDIMTLAKPLGGGLPLGATLVSESVATALKPGDHGTTFGGNPFVSALANVVFDEVSSSKMLEHVNHVGSQLHASLCNLQNKFPQLIAAVRGRGLIWGVDVALKASVVQEACRVAGIVVLTAGEHTLRLLPPLVVQPNHLREFEEKFAGVLYALRSEVGT